MKRGNSKGYTHIKEPVCPLFWGLNTSPQEGSNSYQKPGVIWVFIRIKSHNFNWCNLIIMQRSPLQKCQQPWAPFCQSRRAGHHWRMLGVGPEDLHVEIWEYRLKTQRPKIPKMFVDTYCIGLFIISMFFSGKYCQQSSSQIVQLKKASQPFQVAKLLRRR